MSSRYESMTKEFTKEQLRWLSENPPEEKAITDAENLIESARRLLAARKFSTAEQRDKLVDLASKTVPSIDLESIAKTANFSSTGEGKDARSASQNFMDAYFGGEKDKDQRDLWRRRIIKEYGDNGWSIAKKVLQSASEQQMYENIGKARKDTWDSMPLSGLVGLVRPRFKKSVLEGTAEEGIQKSDIADIGQSALYAIPYGRYAGMGVRALGAIPKIGGVVGGKAAQTLAGLGTQALAPLGMSVMDDKLGQKDFDWRDVGIGTLTNIGVGKGLGKALGAGYQYGMGKIRGRAPDWLIKFLEGSKTPKEIGEDMVADAYGSISGHLKETPKQFFQKLVSGRKPNSLTAEELEKQAQIAAVGDVLRTQGKNVKDRAKQLAESSWDNPMPQASMVKKDPTWQIMANVDAKPDKAAMVKAILDVVPDRITAENAAKGILADESNSLMSLFKPTSVRDELNAAALEGIKGWAVNEYGKDSEATNPARLVGIDVKEERKKQREGAEKKARVKAASILSMDGLGGDDAKYVALIKQNPNIVKFGLNSGNQTEDNKFKNWLLMRGNDILRSQGSGLLRPTPSVE